MASETEKGVPKQHDTTGFEESCRIAWQRQFII